LSSELPNTYLPEKSVLLVKNHPNVIFWGCESFENKLDLMEIRLFFRSNGREKWSKKSSAQD